MPDFTNRAAPQVPTPTDDLTPESDPADQFLHTLGVEYLSPAEEEGPPPATPENLICQVGPCRYYVALILYEDTNDPFDSGTLMRRCRRMSTDDDEDHDITQESITACTSYTPPPWSVIGWATRLKSRRLLIEQHVKEGGPEAALVGGAITAGTRGFSSITDLGRELHELVSELTGKDKHSGS